MVIGWQVPKTKFYLECLLLHVFDCPFKLYLHFEGFSGLGYSIFKMVLTESRGEQQLMVQWQRKRIIIQGILITSLAMCYLVHGMKTKFSILLRDTSHIRQENGTKD